MKVDKDRIDRLSTLENTITPRAWLYTEGVIKSQQGEEIARLCQKEYGITFQQEADGVFIVEMRNAAPYLLWMIKELQEINGRLLKRVLRLESELYDGKDG